MSEHIPEPDWRRFKEIREKLLDRYCGRILDEVITVGRSSNGTAHERYLQVYTLLREHDKQIARAFNDFRRSTAVWQLGIMRRMRLLTDDELTMFSEQTRNQVEMIASL